MENKILLIQTDLVNTGLVKVEDYSRLATYLMLLDIQEARMGNNLDLTKTNPSLWLPISTLPTISYLNLFTYILENARDNDKCQRLLLYRTEDDIGELPDYTLRLQDTYMIINYDVDMYKDLQDNVFELHHRYEEYIKHIIKEEFGKEI